MRYRAKLVAMRSGLKAQIHAVLAKAGVLIAVSDLFGVKGRQRLAKVPLGAAYAQRIRSLLELIDILDSHESAVRRDDRRPASTPTAAIRRSSRCPASDRCSAAVFVAEIGDVHRFTDPAQLCSWAGLTPRHRESDTVVHRGHITKQGSKAGPVGGDRGGAAPPDTAKISADRTTHRGPPRQEHRQGRRGPQTAHAGLLRAARRPHPENTVSTDPRGNHPKFIRSGDSVLAALEHPSDQWCCDHRENLRIVNRTHRRRSGGQIGGRLGQHTGH